MSQFSLRKAGVVLVAVIGLSIAFVACGGGDDSTGGSSGTESTASGTAQGTISIALEKVSPSVCAKVSERARPVQEARRHHQVRHRRTDGRGADRPDPQRADHRGPGCLHRRDHRGGNNLPVVITNAQDEDYSEDGQTAFATVVGKDSGITSFKRARGQERRRQLAAGQLGGLAQGGDREGRRRSEQGEARRRSPFADQVTALKSGRVDAISTLQPLHRAARRRRATRASAIRRRSASTARTTASWTSCSWPRSYVEENDEVVKGFVAAIAGGQRVVQRPPRRGPARRRSRAHEGLAGGRRRDPGAQVHREARPDHDGRLVQAPGEVRDPQEGPGQGPGPVVGSAADASSGR